ncbi:MAG TPA: hypothetical protein C5S37_09170, partial [Methanophagales archaeon]|nr:hypothetical protein [Methanophagales archaeon]
ITIDGVDVLEDQVPALAAGANYMNTVGPFTMSGVNDTIKVCADNGEVVAESDEANNCMENEFEYSGMPDLNVTEKSEEWVSLAEKTYNVTYTVKNIGAGNAGASNTTITIDGVGAPEDPVPALAAGESYTNTVGPFTMSDVSDTIKVCADNGEVVAESDEANNCMENEFVYPGMPDLNVTEKSEEWVSIAEKTYNVTYTVKNVGDAEAGASNTTITIDGVDVLEDQVPALAAGADYTNTVGPFTMSGENDTIKVCADNGEVVAESDEANNCMENEFEAQTPSPCFIATAAYGTPLHEDIDVLRDFRDERLMTNPLGRTLVKTYYETSPPIADALREHEGLRTTVREGLIKPLVYIISREGSDYDEQTTDYTD